MNRVEMTTSHRDRYRGRFAVWGPPGTGKTTFLTRQVEAIADAFAPEDDDPFNRADAPVAVCSLTRTAAAEIAGRGMPVSKRQVGTLHALAYRQLDHPEIAEAETEAWNEFAPEYRMGGESRGNDSALDQLECDWQIELKGDKLYRELCWLRAMRRPRELWRGEVAHFSERWERWKREASLLDFTDLIETAVEAVDEAPGSPSVVIADEAQDLSRLELELLIKWGDAAGCLMLAGDPWQALYVWRGADPTIFTDERIGEDHRRVLSKSYRIPATVHRMAMRWMRRNLSTWTELEYEPRDEEGVIEQSPASWRKPIRAVEQAVELAEEGKSVMLAATCGYMLKPLVAELRDRGIPFSNPWRRKRGDWNPLDVARGTPIGRRILDYLRPDAGTYDPNAPSDAAKPRLWTWQEFANWTAVVKSRGLLKRGAKKNVAANIELMEEDGLSDHPMSEATLRDYFVEAEAWTRFEQLWRERRTVDLLQFFANVLQSSRKKTAAYPIRVAQKHGARELGEEPRIHVGTVHSFKGAEADAVFLFPDLSPAAVNEWEAGGKARDSVVRTFYVGITRAKESLVVCRGSSMAAVSLGGVAVA